MQIVSTVIATADNYDLTTLDVVKDELSIADGKSDATLKRYLSWASAALAKECNRVFVAETVRDQVWPARPLASGFKALPLSRYPVISIVSVTDGGAPLEQDVDFVVEREAGRLLRLGSDGLLSCWSSSPKVAQFEAGFAEIPGDLQDAVTRMVRNRYRAKGRDSYLMSENIPGVRDSRWWIATGNEAGNVPPDIADLIDAYRLPVIV
jgi:hypothetical protein